MINLEQLRQRWRGRHQMVATRSAYQAAVDRAAAFGGPGALITFQSRDRLFYRVRSTSTAGASYRVRVDSRGEVVCDCEAGRRGRPCVHGAAVWSRRVAEGIQYRPVAQMSVAHSGDSAPLAERSGTGVGLSRRWAEDDDRSPLDLLQGAPPLLQEAYV